MRQMGQIFFAPPSVKGWDGGKSWISTSTLLFRNNFANYLINGDSYFVTGGNKETGGDLVSAWPRVEPWRRKFIALQLTWTRSWSGGRGKPEKLIAELSLRILQKEPPAEMQRRSQNSLKHAVEQRKMHHSGSRPSDDEHAHLPTRMNKRTRDRERSRGIALKFPQRFHKTTGSLDITADGVFMKTQSTLQTRRQFFRTSALGAAATWTLPVFIEKTFFVLNALAADAVTQIVTGKDGTILVILQLAGGNDGLNTVVPFADDNYHRVRPKLALPADKILKLDSYVGLNPRLAGLKALHDSGRTGDRSGRRLSKPKPLAFSINGNLANGIGRESIFAVKAGLGVTSIIVAAALTRPWA